MKQVAVIMSTYNGHRYVREQLDSILNQVVDDSLYSIDVYCRDDGSSDTTVDVLKEYESRYPHVHVVSNSGVNKGVPSSFYSLLREVSADYYFFCDQDDVWNNHKIELFLKGFKRLSENRPGGVYSDLNLVDKDNKMLGKTMMEGQSWPYDEKRDFFLFMFQTRVTGAAFAINRLARNKLIKINGNEFSQVLMHDSIAAMLTSVYNNLFFIQKPLVNYRQHGNNVLGAAPIKRSQFDISFKVEHYHRLFHDLKLVDKVLGEDTLPDINRLALKGAIELSESKTFLSRLKSIVDNYKDVWSHFRLRHVVLLLFFYRQGY